MRANQMRITEKRFPVALNLNNFFPSNQNATPDGATNGTSTMGAHKMSPLAVTPAGEGSIVDPGA